MTDTQTDTAGFIKPGHTIEGKNAKGQTFLIEIFSVRLKSGEWVERATVNGAGADPAFVSAVIGSFVGSIGETWAVS